MPAAWIIGPTTFRANGRIVHIEPNYMDEDAKRALKNEESEEEEESSEYENTEDEDEVAEPQTISIRLG